MSTTNRDFRDLFSAFAAREIRFLVVGAYAVTHYARPRFTKDLDLWVDPDPENAGRVLAALADFGAPVAGLSAADLARPRTVFQIGVPPTRIDILTSVAGLAFASCWRRRTAGTYGGIAVQFLGKRDLLRNKRLVGRPQDLLDVRALERAGRIRPPGAPRVRRRTRP
jgi:hypothetical protein